LKKGLQAVYAKGIDSFAGIVLKNISHDALSPAHEREVTRMNARRIKKTRPASAFSARIRVIALPLAFIVLASLAGCMRVFFKPGKHLVEDAEVRQYAPEEVFFKSRDGLNLSGWFFKARGRERGTILVCHGNVQNMGTHVKLDLWLIDAGYNLFIFDYRGYGRSEGEPDVQGINLDAETALETLLARFPKEGRDGVIVFGKSLGGAVAVYMVATSPYKDRVRALVLDSAFSSYRMIAREKIADSVIGWPFQYPLSYLVNDEYSAVKYIARVSPVPLVIIAGQSDPIVPLHHGRILYEAALPPKQFWEVNLPGHVRSQADETTRRKLLSFFEGLGKLP
jgi:fermentation-respiration switch protein FrsA (DUF1100 family)